MMLMMTTTTNNDVVVVVTVVVIAIIKKNRFLILKVHFHSHTRRWEKKFSFRRCNFPPATSY